MIIDTPVHIALEDEVDPQPIAVECPACFAIVRRSKLTMHAKVMHAATVEHVAPREAGGESD